MDASLGAGARDVYLPVRSAADAADRQLQDRPATASDSAGSGGLMADGAEQEHGVVVCVVYVFRFL
jgi:hypothetical protein